MIIVTGATGFIGSNIVADLNARGRTDLLLVDDLGTHGKWKNVAKRRFLDIVDYRELDKLLPTLTQADAVFHMGANSSTTSTDGDEILAVNLHATMAWWKWCTRTGTPFIYASSAATYGDGQQGFDDNQAPEALDQLAPLNLYGWSKHQFDKWAVERASEGAAPPQWAGLKFFNVYGPNEYHKGDMKSLVAKNTELIARGETIRLFKSHKAGYADGAQLRDFVYVKDCCAVMMWLLDNRQASGVFNLGTGQARSFVDLMHAIGAALNKPVNIEYVDQIVGPDTTVAERAEIRKNLGLDDPVLVQFARYAGSVARGQFGISYQFRQPVAQLLAERMPATLELAFCATVFALVVGVLMGVYCALRRDSWLAGLFQAVSLIGISLPTFLIGILLIYLFSVTLGWLPSYGRGDTVRLGWWTTGFLTASGLKALILPSVTLGLFQMTLIMRLVRAEMLEVLRTDYIRFARARGLTTRAVHLRHALKNTLVPVITIAGLQLGSVIAFSIITETVFQWPGMGLLFVQAVQNVDIPIMSAYLLLVALIFVTINLVVDILYTVVDPRLRLSSATA